MMKKYIIMAFLALGFAACQNDDTDFSAYTEGGSSTASTIYITYSGSSVTVTGDNNGYVTTSGADVTVDCGTDTDSLLLVLSGSTDDGSLLIYREKKFGMILNGVTINNEDGPAINNQCGKSLYLEVADGTTNTLTDGTSYTDQDYQQKGTFFSEGQIIFSGTGTLNITGSAKHALASDDYIVIDEDVVLNIACSTGHGIKINDGFLMNAGTVDVTVTGDGCRGIKCDSVTVINDGSLTIDTSGDCLIETTDGVTDTTSAACIKSDYQVKVTGGTVTLTSSGDGGKGVNCDTDFVMTGGTFSAVTSGDNEEGKPKAVKADGGITLSGGSFHAQTNKSWACDNGSDSDTYSERVTISGTPSSTATITVDDVEYTSPYYGKKLVFVAF